MAASANPHPALRATFPPRGKEFPLSLREREAAEGGRVRV